MILQGVSDFVSRHGDGRQRMAGKLVFGQADDFGFRIVVIALVGRFDVDRLQAVPVEQVAGELGPGSGIAIGWHAVAFENALHPDTRAENDYENQQDENGDDHLDLPRCLGFTLTPLRAAELFAIAC